jgi:predicted transposase/invertase (TIGR01784 family)
MARKVKYLDPKNDLTFRKIFGERPHLLISFLNSVLPLGEGQKIETITYINPEFIPELPGFKRSMVDVSCTDNQNRCFIVEMQMYWTSSFKKRMLFNAGKAYVRQLRPGGKYRDLKPVYGLSLVDDIFHTRDELKNIFYHHYKIVHTRDSNECLPGLELIFVELPKFKAQNFTDKRLQTLWFRFLTEIDEETDNAPVDLLSEESIREALECVQKEAFTEEELAYYDQYWDAVRLDKAAIDDFEEKQLEYQRRIEEAETQKKEAKRREEEAIQREEEAKQREQEAKKREEEAKQGEEEAKQREEEARKKEEEAKKKEYEVRLKLARQMKKYGANIENIMKETGLGKEEVERL